MKNEELVRILMGAAFVVLAYNVGSGMADYVIKYTEIMRFKERATALRTC